jgi:hypothetical protein
MSTEISPARYCLTLSWRSNWPERWCGTDQQWERLSWDTGTWVGLPGCHRWSGGSDPKEKETRIRYIVM